MYLSWKVVWCFALFWLLQINSISPKDLSSAVNDIGSVVSLIDRMAGSAPGNGSRAPLGEDLVAITKCCLQARNLVSQDGSAATKRMRRHMSSMPLSTASSGGSVTNSLQQHNNLESPEMESTATSKIKRPRLGVCHAYSLISNVWVINLYSLHVCLFLLERRVNVLTRYSHISQHCPVLVLLHSSIMQV